MPMDFPDMRALEKAAEVWKFRKLEEGETEAHYRTALADHVQPKDLVESMEIRTSHGWNQFSPEENREMLLKRSGAHKLMK